LANTYNNINIASESSGGVPGESNPPYAATVSVSSWSDNGSEYEFNVPQSTHSRGAVLAVQTYELDGSDYSEVEVNTIVNTSGDVKITISSSPDLRFDGRIIIVGE